MKTQQYNNLVQLTRLSAFNSYLVIEADSLTVVDTNMPGSAGGILKAAAQIGKPITRIVLTHSHNDHVGSLDGLVKKLPGVEVIISEREAKLLAGDKQLLPGEPTNKLRGSYTVTKAQPTRTVNDGDMIGSLRVIAAPGHTPGHMALLDTRDNTLIAGDAFSTSVETVVAGKANLLFPFPAWATWSKACSLETAHRLRALNPVRLAVGHGRVLADPLPEMDRAIATATQKFGM